jgi:hypothetical protein
MKRMMLPATAALITLTPAVAAAKPPTAAHARAYEYAYQRVAHQLGRRVPGRNIVRDGFAAHQAATEAETVASLAVLERMLAPVTTTSSAPPIGALAGARSAGGAGVPACASESGTNYSTGVSNTDTSSGATGRYQILPSTAAAYGCSLATAAGQDACAQTIYQHQGAGAWVGCGG